MGFSSDVKKIQQMLKDTAAANAAAMKEAYGPSQEEKDLLASLTSGIEKSEARQEAFEPIMLEEMGYRVDPATGEYVKMSEDELLETMSPLERANYDLQLASAEHSRLALAGELDVPESIEENMARQREMTEAKLAGQGLKAGDTGYDKAIAEMDHQQSLLLYGVRHGEISMAEAISASRAGISGAASDRFSQQAGAFTMGPAALSSAYGQPLGYMQGNRQLGLQADLGYAQIAAGERASRRGAEATETAGFWGGVGTIAGFGAAALISSEELKEDIELYEGSALDELLNTEIYRFKYKDGIADSSEHIGMIAEEVAEDLKALDGKGIDVSSAIGLTIAAVKELAKKVKKNG
jgi:hypothetical protein